MDYANRFLCIAMPGAFVAAVVAFDGIGARAVRAGDHSSWGSLGLALARCAQPNSRRCSGAPTAPSTQTTTPLMTRLGLELAAATAPEAVRRSGVGGGGAVLVGASRPSICSGKNDRVVAHGPPRGPKTPGHNKWDVRHSVGALRPDVVFQTAHVWVEPGFWRIVNEAGYERLPNGIVIRKDSDRFDRDALAAMDSPDL